VAEAGDNGIEAELVDLSHCEPEDDLIDISVFCILKL